MAKGEYRRLETPNEWRHQSLFAGRRHWVTVRAVNGPLSFTLGEKIRIVGWSLALASAALGWNVFLWKWDSTATPSWLVTSILATAAAFGVLGGAIVPRRRASLVALLVECGAGAGAVGGACLFIWFVINASEGGPDNPFALGLGALFIAAGTFVVLCPGFLSAYGLRAMLVRVAAGA